jgi:multidrug resistance efflux pump
MTNAPETNGQPLEAPAPAAALRGTALRDRVQSLRLQPGGPAGRPRGAWLPWGLTLIALAAAGVFAWRAYRLSAEDVTVSAVPVTAAPAKTLTAATTADSPAPVAGSVVLDAKGYVVAAHQIQLSPQTGGEIIWLDPSFKEGAVYQKGDRLAEIDPVMAAAMLKSARAALRVAEANLQQADSGSLLNNIETAKAQLKNLAAKVELARVEDRHNQRAGSAISPQDREKAAAQVKVEQTAYDVQKETLARLEVALQEQRLVARAQLLKAQAEVEHAEKELQNCTIKAPTTGIVLSKKAELGGYVNPLAFGAAGYLCEMADLRDLEVELDIQERDSNRVKPGQHCRIMPEAGQHDEAFLKTHSEGYTGFVSRRLPVANRSKGAVTVRVKVEIPTSEQSGEYLLPDMGVMVSFLKQGQ